MHKFVDSSSFIPFSTLCDIYGLPNSEIFRYLQIKNFFSPFLSTNTPLNKLTNFEVICKDEPHARGLISLLYSQGLTQPNSENPSYVQKWEEDLGKTLESADWNLIWSVTKSASPNVLAVEANYKVLTRWYLVPVRVAKYTQNYSAQCFHGCTELGTYFHVWWTCPIAQNYWKEIFHIASKLLNINLSLDPTMALLNLKPEFLSHTRFKLLIQLFMAAKQTLAKAWQSPTLVANETIHRMYNTMIQAKMLTIETDRITRYEKLWQPWIDNFMPSAFDKKVLLPW